MLTYNKTLKKYSRQLRKNLTDAEVALWSKIRGKQLKSYQFYRQKPIGNFIVDFYSPKANLIIELDGGQHYSEEGKIKDEYRDSYLEGMGLHILRFSDREVFEDISGVLEKIGSSLVMEGNPPLSPFRKGGSFTSKEMLSEHRTPITNNPAPTQPPAPRTQNPEPRTQNLESNTQHRESFTLMEMMLVVSLFTVVMGIVYTALSLNDMSRQTIGAQIELYRKNKQAHNAIALELRRSSPTRVVINDNNPDTVCFQIPVDTDNNYDIIWGDDPVTNTTNSIRYRLDSNNLIREVVNDCSSLTVMSARIITSGITDLQLQPLILGGITSVAINTTAQKTARGRIFTSNSTSQVYPRNR